MDFTLARTGPIVYDYIPVNKIWIQYTKLFKRYRTETLFCSYGEQYTTAPYPHWRWREHKNIMLLPLLICIYTSFPVENIYHLWKVCTSWGITWRIVTGLTVTRIVLIDSDRQWRFMFWMLYNCNCFICKKKLLNVNHLSIVLMSNTHCFCGEKRNVLLI